MAGKVVVHDIANLAQYCQRLSSLKDKLEETATKLAALSDTLQQTAAAMGSATNDQSGNWQDPQYEKLRGEITPCVSAVNSTSESVKQTAAIIKNQMPQVANSITYIQNLVHKLNDIS